MSKTGQWFFDLQEKHYANECEDKCQFCANEPYESFEGNYDEAI